MGCASGREVDGGTRFWRRATQGASLVTLLALFASCDLTVASPSVITDDEVQGPVGIHNRLHGLIGDLATATENRVVYGGLFTDEFLHAGTFRTRLQVDERRVLASNATVTVELEVPLHVARAQADRLVADFQDLLDEEGENGPILGEGIAIGHYVGGLARLWLGVFWCRASPGEGASPVASDRLVQAGLSRLEAAEAAAGREGAKLSEWADAARLAQARAHLWLGDHQKAADVAAQVRRGHRLYVEYSDQSPEQFNRVFELTHGSRSTAIRMTVGDGTQASRHRERFAVYDTFVELGIVDPEPGPSRRAHDNSIDVNLQLLYDEASDDVLISTGTYARLIEAEALIRTGATAAAEELINGVRADFHDRWSADRFPIDGRLEPIALTGGVEEDLRLLMDEYAREGWLAGTRQENLRRLVDEFGDDTAMDLYPPKPGDQECLPVSEREQTGGIP